MAGRLLRDPDNDGWERSDFPIVCETCLGPNPFVRMQRIEFGGTCHISGRPYTVFRWRPGNEARYKKTIICQEVAKAKNVCQVCLFDLEYGLPVQVRDQALGIAADDEPQSEVGKEYKLQQQSREGTLGSEIAGKAPNDLLLRLQRTTPYYKRNESRICSFFVKGNCNRGAECPYRHEMPKNDELSDQNIKDRYYGINDPVANKMLRRVAEAPALVAPEDQGVTTLYVGGLTQDISDDDLRDAFYSFGEIVSLRRVAGKFCAFITFATRAAAEKAAEGTYSKLVLKGQRLKVLWGRPPAQGRPDGDALQQPSTSGRPGGGPPPSMLPPQGGAPNYFNLPPGGGPVYASMDPQAMGTRIPAPGEQQHKRGPGPDGGAAGGGGEEGPDAKRARGGPPGSAPPNQGPPPGTGYGAPMMPPPMGMPPPGYGMPPPGYAMPPPGWGPPRPPYGGPPGPYGMPPPQRPPMMPWPHPGGPPPGGPPPAGPPPAGGPPPQAAAAAAAQQPGGPGAAPPVAPAAAAAPAPA